jgi:mRNA interferase MazF
VLVVTRSAAVPVLSAILVAPITRSVRGIATEVALGRRHGLSDDCCASFDNLQRVRPRLLTERVGQLDVDDRQEICRALGALADC